MDIVTLVPAFKPQYLPELLAGLRFQTLQPRRIVFSDDSPAGAYRAALYADALAPLRAALPPIECIDGPRRGGYPNVLHLLKHWAGSSSLVHVLLDDDGLYPEFYERHVSAHASARLSCTVSRRWTADNAGRPLAGQKVPTALDAMGQRVVSLDADVLFMTTAAACKNWLGEFSNAVFRAEAVGVLERPMFEGVSYAGLWDLGAFLAASQIAPLGHIQDHLGFFRTGGAGNSTQLFGKYMKGAFMGYAALALGGRRLGRCAPAQWQQAFQLMAEALPLRYASQPDLQPLFPLLARLAAGDDSAESEYVPLWHAWLGEQDFL